jgi:hypothetical protein
MTGEMAVGIVFVESSRSGGPKFSNSERNDICNEILGGHSWLTSEHPEGNLSWVCDIQFIKIDVANGSGDPQEDYWRDPQWASSTTTATRTPRRGVELPTTARTCASRTARRMPS